MIRQKPERARQARRQGAALTTDPIQSAKIAGLRYVSDERPGIRRMRAGKGFRYVGPDGQPVRDRQVLERIKSLGIPPAYRDVWICPTPNGHLQATGRDARGRKQYRYHPRWRDIRDETKYGRMIAFGKALPCIRARVEEDLSRRGLPREKVLATVVRLLETTHIRVGNEEYARSNDSYGLTTLRDEHADVHTRSVCFYFRGKSGKEHGICLTDPRLARIVQRCRDIPGQELFQYLDEQGERHALTSEEVNAYLREITGEDFTAKDFRTWAGTVLAAVALCRCEPGDSETAKKRNIAAAVKEVAGRLGNTPTVCRKCYIHPAILAAYQEDRLPEIGMEAAPLSATQGLRPEEAAVLELLEQAAG